MQIRRLQQGFTLIELMLTIAVMAALVTIGIASYQQKMQNSKIDQAALHIQNWLQAGLAFRVNTDVDRWPLMHNLIRDGYIKNYSTPWRDCDSKTVANCYEVGESDKASKNFVVRMRVPASVPNIRAVIDMVVKRLPNAECLPEALCNGSGKPAQDLLISAEVPLPAQVAGNVGQVIIKNIRYVENTDPHKIAPTPKLPKIETVLCPNKMKPKRFSSLVNFDGRAGLRYFNTSLWGTEIKEETSGDEASIYPNPILYNLIYNEHSYKGKVMVIDACIFEPTTATNVNAAANDFIY